MTEAEEADEMAGDFSSSTDEASNSSTKRSGDKNVTSSNLDSEDGDFTADSDSRTDGESDSESDGDIYSEDGNAIKQ